MSADLTSRLEALLEDIARLTFVETNTVLFQRVHAPAVRDAIETLRQLSAPSAIRTIPDGWKLVPIQPTRPMRISGAQALRRSTDEDRHVAYGRAFDCWDAMMSAAPLAAAPAEAQEPPRYVGGFCQDRDKCVDRNARVKKVLDRQCTNPKPVGDSACDCCAHHWLALKGFAPEVAPKVCRADGRCQYAIDHGAEGMGHCPVGKCAMPAEAAPPPLYAGNVFMIDGKPHRTCDCSPSINKCARGLPRTLLTTEFSRCMVPV
jgi:hypothetical protein